MHGAEEFVSEDLGEKDIVCHVLDLKRWQHMAP
jgi:hypothetical protein